MSGSPPQRGPHVGSPAPARIDRLCRDHGVHGDAGRCTARHERCPARTRSRRTRSKRRGARRPVRSRCRYPGLLSCGGSPRRTADHLLDLGEKSDGSPSCGCGGTPAECRRAPSGLRRPARSRDARVRWRRSGRPRHESLRARRGTRECSGAALREADPRTRLPRQPRGGGGRHVPCRRWNDDRIAPASDRLPSGPKRVARPRRSRAAGLPARAAGRAGTRFVLR